MTVATAPDGTRLNVLLAGAGPPIVLVGGKTSSIESAWWRYIPVLAQSHHVIAYDNRGAGQSEKPDQPYTTALMAGDGMAVLDAAGESSAHWFGVSLGGMIIQQLALDRPEAVRSLILAATHCGGATPLKEPSPEDAAALVRNPHRRLAHLYATTTLEQQADWVAADAAHFGKMPLHAIHRQDQAVFRHNTCDRLSLVRCPALIIHGRQDRMVPVARAEELHRLLPGSELRLLEPAGHQVLSERFAEVLPAVTAFVARVEDERTDPD